MSRRLAPSCLTAAPLATPAPTRPFLSPFFRNTGSNVTPRAHDAPQIGDLQIARRRIEEFHVLTDNSLVPYRIAATLRAGPIPLRRYGLCSTGTGWTSCPPRHDPFPAPWRPTPSSPRPRRVLGTRMGFHTMESHDGNTTRPGHPLPSACEHDSPVW